MNRRALVSWIAALSVASLSLGACDSNGDASSAGDASSSDDAPANDSGADVSSTKDSAPDDSASEDSGTDGSTPDGSTPDGSTPDGSTPDGSPSVDADVLTDGAVLARFPAIASCAEFATQCEASCATAKSAAKVGWCKPYCANAAACCQDVDPSGGSSPIAAIPARCRVAALWNAQGKKPYLCPVPAASDGSCPCPASSTKCPAYPVTSDDIAATP